MISSHTEPRPETFGVTAQEVEEAPTPFVTAHRSQLVIVAGVLVLSAAFALLLAVTGDALSAAFFAVVATAAASILMLPVVICLLCAGERAEIAWMCRRSPKVAACLAYREALERYQSAPRTADRTRGRQWFVNAGRAATRTETARRLQARGFDVDTVEEPDIEGFDLLARDAGRILVLRCLPGHQPADPAVGREMSAVVSDRGADVGVIIAAAGVTPELERYVRSRPLFVIDPVDLATVTI